MDERGWILGRGRDLSSSPMCLYRLWSPPSIPSSGYRGLFPLGRAAEAWNWPLSPI